MLQDSYLMAGIFYEYFRAQYYHLLYQGYKLRYVMLSVHSGFLSSNLLRRIRIWLLASLVLLHFLQGMALTKVPKIKFLIIIGGAKLKSPSLAEKAYSSTIQCQSVHFLGISLSSFVCMAVNDYSLIKSWTFGG